MIGNHFLTATRFGFYLRHFQGVFFYFFFATRQNDKTAFFLSVKTLIKTFIILIM